jgi:hydrogenase maturation protease
MRLLVIGCGNPLAGDDSAGLGILRRLQARSDCGCELRAAPQAGVGLLEFFDQADVLLFVDAVSSGAPAGTLHLLPLPSPEVESRGIRTLSGHGWDLPQTLALARALGRRIPKLMLLGVEMASVTPFVPRAADVEEAIALVVDRFPRLRSMLLDAASEIWREPQSFFAGDDSFLKE